MREQRRVKQRLANIGRAARMHSGASEFTKREKSLLRLRSPRESFRNSTWAAQAGSIGTGGAPYIPHDLPTKNWFAHYAKHFKTVELNAPFYSWPTPATVSSWLRQAGRRKFIYTVKVSELITHVKRFTGTRTLVHDFGHIADLLGPRMGCFLFQLPSEFFLQPSTFGPHPQATRCEPSKCR